jgi:O-antigen ligase
MISRDLSPAYHDPLAPSAPGIRLEWLLLLGFLLLPFSTAAGERSIVFSFGLPVLAPCALLMLVKAGRSGFAFPREHGFTVVMAVLYAACTVGFSFLAEQPMVSLWRALVNVLGLAIFLYMVHQATQPAREREIAFIGLNRILFLSGMVMGAYYIVNMLLVASQHGMVAVFSERFVGGLIALPWGATNSIASALLMPLCGSMIALQIPGERKLAVAAMIVMMATILLTVSRNGISCMALMAVVWAVLFRRFFLLFLSIALAGGAAWMLETIEPGTLEFLYETRLENTAEIYALNHRMDIWEDSIEHLKTYPFEPVGYYGVLDLFSGLSPHNVLLTTTLEMGWFGLFVFLGLWANIFARTIWSAFHARGPSRTHAMGLLAGLTAVAVNLQFEDPNYTHQYILYSWMFLGLVVLGATRESSASDDPSHS